MKIANKKTTTPIYVKTASFYGFLSAADYIENFGIQKTDLLKAKSVLTKDPASLIAEKVGLVRMFLDKKMAELPQPTMIYYKGFSRSTFNLDILGNSKSIADAILIETSYVIAKEEYKDCHVSVEINTIGDKESQARLQRELNTYYKKNASKIPKELRPLYRKNIFESFKTNNPKAIELRNDGPDSFKGLTEQSRQHFKEVLEYIENLDIPYTINPYLLGDMSYATDTLFEVIAANKKTNETKIVARGQRYNGVSKKFFGRKDIPSIGSTIKVKKESFDCKGKGKAHIPKFFFIQLSFDAKLQSLQVLEMFRKAHMDVYQSLSKDKMTAQISLAEKMNIPYVIIMGKKEAMEKSVLVRNMFTRCQDTVYLSDLVEYVKKLK